MSNPLGSLFAADSHSLQQVKGMGVTSDFTVDSPMQPEINISISRMLKHKICIFKSIRLNLNNSIEK